MLLTWISYSTCAATPRGASSQVGASGGRDKDKDEDEDDDEDDERGRMHHRYRWMDNINKYMDIIERDSSTRRRS